MKRIFIAVTLILLTAFVLSGCRQDQPSSETPGGERTQSVEGEGLGFIVETDKGEIKGELFPDVAPNTVLNFVTLARGDFYENLTFHRVVPGFVIQGGDPKGDGTGGPGYSIPAEFNSRKHTTGTLAMARASHPDSAGSQFYITLNDTPNLDNNYTVFGRVTEGMPIVLSIEKGDIIRNVKITGELPEELKGQEIKKSNI